MKFKLLKLDQLSGRKASVYVVVPFGQSQSLFEQFLEHYAVQYPAEVDDIVKRLMVIGHDQGARIDFFKPNEGKLGDLVSALYDDPDSNLRLYCIRYSNTTIILGGGGPKGKQTRRWQEDQKLTKHVNEMITISKMILQRTLDKDISWSYNQKDLLGDLDFYEDE